MNISNLLFSSFSYHAIITSWMHWYKKRRKVWRLVTQQGHFVGPQTTLPPRFWEGKSMVSCWDKQTYDIISLWLCFLFHPFACLIIFCFAQVSKYFEFLSPIYFCQMKILFCKGNILFSWSFKSLFKFRDLCISVANTFSISAFYYHSCVKLAQKFFIYSKFCHKQKFI